MKNVTKLQLLTVTGGPVLDTSIDSCLGLSHFETRLAMPGPNRAIVLTSLVTWNCIGLSKAGSDFMGNLCYQTTLCSENVIEPFFFFSIKHVFTVQGKYARIYVRGPIYS